MTNETVRPTGYTAAELDAAAFGRPAAGWRRQLYVVISADLDLFTALFTIEYVARLVCVERPRRYARSFYGVVDLVSVLPTYLAIFLPELHALIDVRVLRMLRVFRISNSLRLNEHSNSGLLGAPR